MQYTLCHILRLDLHDVEGARTRFQHPDLFAPAT
jgi:hypothetical protein